MIPFLGIDLTDNKKNVINNGEEFLVSEVSEVMQDALDDAIIKAIEVDDEAKLPLPFRVIQWISGFLATILVLGVLDATVAEELTLKEAYNNAPLLFWLMPICLIMYIILKTIEVKKENRVYESAESAYTVSSIENVSEMITQELRVPYDAETVDVLLFCYKVKNGEVKVVAKGMEMTPYDNLIFRLYKDDDNIYLANLEEKYAFPLKEIKGIRKVEKKISVPDWNKDTEPNKGEYKQYKLVVDKYGCIHFKPYYILELEHKGELWGIYFPNYELEKFEEVTGSIAI